MINSIFLMMSQYNILGPKIKNIFKLLWLLYAVFQSNNYINFLLLNTFVFAFITYLTKIFQSPTLNSIIAVSSILIYSVSIDIICYLFSYNVIYQNIINYIINGIVFNLKYLYINLLLAIILYTVTRKTLHKVILKLKSQLNCCKLIFSSMILFLIACTTNKTSAKITFFDLKQHQTDIIYQYKNYRKTQGFLKAYLYGLSVVPKGVIIDDYLSDADILNVKSILGNILMCRPDAPVNEWYGLPRGKDLNPEDLNSFLTECKKINTKAVLLCFMHPSIYFTGSLVERYKISGAVNVIIDWGNCIDIEYVGSGYDCGELSRGFSSSHTTISTPWIFTDCPPWFMWNHSSIKNVNQEEYAQSRISRIKTLCDMGYPLEIIKSSIPAHYKNMDKKLFCDIHEKCIKKIIKSGGDFDVKSPVMIMINLYEDQQHIFEIWNSKS